MISNRFASGLDLLEEMISAAARRASTQLYGKIRFAQCEHVQVHHDIALNEVNIETWSVSKTAQSIVISVFATSPQKGGGQIMAASGRFTFTPITHKREYAA